MLDEKKEAENAYLESMIRLEDLAEKKANIYARLLMDVALAKKMETLSLRHKTRKEGLRALLYGEGVKEKSSEKQGGKSATNDEGGEE